MDELRDLNKISVLVPVFRESTLLEGLLTDILKDPYPSKEVLVVIDEPTDTSLNVVAKFKNRIVFTLNEERVGKVKALNEALSYSSGNILLFLDSDVQLQAAEAGFLEILEKEMEEIDILDIKKSTIRCSVLEKLVGYEYLGSSLVSWFFSKHVGKTLGLNGAAFAIRREAFERLGGFRRTIVDDFDLATRSFVENMSFKYTDRLSVSIKPQPGWSGWLKQRRRWGIATGVWLKDYYGLLARVWIKKPQVMLPSLLLMMPSLLLFLFNLMLPDTLYLNILTLILSIVSRQPSFIPVSIFLTTFGVLALRNSITSAIAFASLSCIFYLAAKRLGYHFNPIEFLGYCLIYSPLSLLMNIVGIFRVFTNRDMIDLDWKI